jgi:hypothetical protein
MVTASATNGKPQRKQLSEQLDRFDAMLDGLSEGLSEAVAEAARTGTRLAVKDAIIEILTDAELRSKLRDAVEPPQVVAPESTRVGFWGWLKGGVLRIGQTLGIVRATVTEAAASSARRLGESLAAPLSMVRVVGSMKRLMIVGMSVGGILAVLSYVMPHFLSATLAGISGAVAAMTVQLGFWARRTFRIFSVT